MSVETITSINPQLLHDIRNTAENKLQQLSLKRRDIQDLQNKFMSLRYNMLNNEIQSIHNNKTNEQLSAARMKAQQELEHKLASPKNNNKRNSVIPQQQQQHHQQQHDNNNKLTVNISDHNTTHDNNNNNVTVIHSPSHAAIHHYNDEPISTQLQHTLDAMRIVQDNELASKLASRQSIMYNLSYELQNTVQAKQDKHNEIKQKQQEAISKTNSLKNELINAAATMSHRHAEHRAIKEYIHDVIHEQHPSFKIVLSELKTDNMSKLKSTIQKSQISQELDMQYKLAIRQQLGRKASFSHNRHNQEQSNIVA